MCEARNKLDRPEERCYFNLEDEVMKLYALILTCSASKKDEYGEYLSRDYLLEKVGRLNQRIPISLDPKAKEIFDMMIDDYRKGLFSMNYEEIKEFYSSPRFQKLRIKNNLRRMSIGELTVLSMELEKGEKNEPSSV
jgi:hypothetical protein